MNTLLADIQTLPHVRHVAAFRPFGPGSALRYEIHVADQEGASVLIYADAGDSWGTIVARIDAAHQS